MNDSKEEERRRKEEKKSFSFLEGFMQWVINPIFTGIFIGFGQFFFYFWS